MSIVRICAHTSQLARENPPKERVLRTDRIVFHHAEGTVSARPHQSSVVARHGHRNEAHHNGAGFRCKHVLSVKLLVVNQAGTAVPQRHWRIIRMLEGMIGTWEE